MRADRGVYRLPKPSDAPTEPKNPRGETENTETINKMLNLYDKLLDTVAVSIEEEDWDGIIEKIEAIKSLRWLGATVDQLKKRWYCASGVRQQYETSGRGREAEDRESREASTGESASRGTVGSGRRLRCGDAWTFRIAPGIDTERGHCLMYAKEAC